jgi:hypothetical protein
MTKTHMWKRLSMLGLIQVKCGRKVRSTQFTNDPGRVTCVACLKKMSPQTEDLALAEVTS